MNAGEKARFEPFVFSVSSIAWIRVGFRIDHPLFAGLFPHPEILQRTNAAMFWEERRERVFDSKMKGVLTIYTRLVFR